MLAFLEGPDLVIVLAIVLVIFGGSQLPKLARSLGQAQRELHKGLRDDVDADEPSVPVTSSGSDSVVLSKSDLDVLLRAKEDEVRQRVTDGAPG